MKPTLLARAALASMLALLTGCAPFNYTGPDAPQALTAVAPMQPPPRVALVLSSGGPRGYAHIGVMRVLEEAGVPVDLIVGSSVGSLLGAFWADGKSAAEIDALSQTGGPFTLFDVSPFADRGWIHGRRLQDYVNRGLTQTALERMPRRLVVGATRRFDKAPVFFTSGNAGVAVRASSAVPGRALAGGHCGCRVRGRRRILPLAVRAARQAGARFVIAVDVTPKLEIAPPGTSEWQLERVAKRRPASPEAAQADFLIHADPAVWGLAAAELLQAGEEGGERSARAQLPALLASLARAGIARADGPEPAATSR